MSTTTKACERCGRPIVVNLTRPKPPVRCCRDCRSSDPEYVRLRTSMACGARGFEGVRAVGLGTQRDAPERELEGVTSAAQPSAHEGN